MFSFPKVENISDVSETMEVEAALSQYIEVGSFIEGTEFLESLGVFKESGIFLSDSDYTIRQSAKELLRGTPDRIDPVVHEKLLSIKNKPNWDLAIITDQPDKGHQIAALAGKVKGYTPLLKFAQQNDIEILGGHNDLVSFIIKEGGRYKKHERALEETLAMLRRKNALEQQNVVWIGDTQEDVVFGESLESRLRDLGYNGKFYLLKIEK